MARSSKSRSRRPARTGSDQPRVVTYKRVSTDMQNDEGWSMAAQDIEMRQLADARGWVIVAEFTDPGISGQTIHKRPGIQALLSAAEQKQFDILLVHDLSRLSRSIYDTLYIFQELGRLNIGFASVKEPDFDFTTPTGKLVLTVLAALNQYYLDMLSQHTKKGKHQRARNGLYNASIVPYGYQHVGDSKTPPAIDEETAVAVRLAFESYATGNFSFQQIADLLNDKGYQSATGRLFTKDSIDDLLRNRFYAGDIVYGGDSAEGEQAEVYPGQHEAIISRDLFEQTQQARDRRRGSIRSYQPAYRTYMLNTLATCSVCGRKLRAQTLASGKSYYREMSRARGFVDCPDAQNGVLADPVETEIDHLFSSLRLPEDWQQQIETLIGDDDELDTLDNRRARLQAEKTRLRELYVKGHFGDDIAQFESLTAQIQRELDLLPPTDLPAIERAANTLQDLSQVWAEASKEEQRDLVRLVLREVRIDAAQKTIAELLPYAPFMPLFRQLDALIETEPGRFALLWPPDLAAQRCPYPVLPSLTELQPPEETPHLWPLLIPPPPLAPELRISPLASDFLKAWPKDTALGDLVDVVTPGVEPLRVDGRKWPQARLRTLTQPKDTTLILPLDTGSAALLHTPFQFQASLNQSSWLEEAWRVLQPGGWWAFSDLLPARMPGHWLYRFLPDAVRAWLPAAMDDAELYGFLTKRGFGVRLTRQTRYRAVTLGAVGQALTSRLGLLARLPEDVHRVVLADVQAEIEAQGAETLIASHECWVEVVAVKSG